MLYGNNERIIQFYSDILVNYLKKNDITSRYVDAGQNTSFAPEEPCLFSSTQSKYLNIYKDINNKNTDAILTALKKSQPHEYLLFTSNKINSKSKLVMHFNASDALCAIPCYEMTKSYMQNIITQELADRKISLSTKQIETLAEQYSTHPVSFFNDLYKIQLHNISDNKAITDYQLTQLIPNIFNLSIDDIVSNFLLKEKTALFKCIDEKISNDEIFFILRSLIKQMMLFCEFLTQYNLHKNCFEAFSNMTNNVFFNMKPIFEKASRLWQYQEISASLETLLTLEKQFKNKEVSFAVLVRSIVKSC